MASGGVRQRAPLDELYLRSKIFRLQRTRIDRCELLGAPSRRERGAIVRTGAPRPARVACRRADTGARRCGEPCRGRSRVARPRRPSRDAAPLAAPAHLHADDRGPRAHAAARAIRDDAAALRPDGAARAQSEGPQDGRAVAPPDGDRRQRHRHHRSAGRRGSRPARADRRETAARTRCGSPPRASRRSTRWRSSTRAGSRSCCRD